MSELTAEVRVVIEAHDRPTARIDDGEIAILPTGRAELVLHLSPDAAGPWLRELETRVREALDGAGGDGRCGVVAREVRGRRISVPLPSMPSFP